MARRILSGVILILCAGTALAQLSTENITPDAASNAPVAFVYVSRPTHIDGFALLPSGRLSPVPGSPLANAAVSHLSVSRKYLFGVGDDRQTIYSYSINSSGSIKQVAEINAQSYAPSASYVTGQIQIDGTGSTLYNYLQESGSATYLQAFQIESNGALKFLANTPSDYHFAVDEIAPTMIQFLGNNQYAIQTGCDTDAMSPASDVFKRESSGVLKVASWVGQVPKAQTGDIFCPFILATDPGNHVAFEVADMNRNDGTVLAWQLATYTADSTGHLTTASTWKNMPESGLGDATAMSIDPTGKLLALGGLGFQLFHYNGADPITPYTDLLQASDNVLEFGWDTHNHLIVLSDGQLRVYTVTPTSFKEQPGSPYSIPEASSVIVLSLSGGA